MDTTTINGLHSCKPGNDPVIGQVKLFVIENRKGKSGKPYIKIRSANAENGGTPHRILNAEKTDFVDPHGNLSFNLEVEATTAQPSAFQHARTAMSETRRGEQQGDPDHGQRHHPRGDDEQDWPEAPENHAQSPPPRSNGNGGVSEARKHLMQSVNLLNLCIDAVNKAIAPNVPEIAQTSEFFQAQVATLFIEASRAGFVDKMPNTPIKNGN